MATEQLADNDMYLKAGVHIGTKFKTKYMEPFIFKVRPDGLAVLDMAIIDERIRQTADFLSQFRPEDILVVSRRENAWKPAVYFGRSTGAQVITGRYPPGILTNPGLETFIEPKVIIATDPWPDRNAIKDARKMGIPVVGFCDTNNTTQDIDVVLPINNKGKKSLALGFFLLAREYMKKRGIIETDSAMPYEYETFIAE